MTMTDIQTPKAARFWNRIAAKYARDPVADQPAYERKLAETAKRMTPEMRVLELACGTGTTSLIHASRVAHIDAVDFSEKMIDIAKAKDNPTGNVHFHVSSNLGWKVHEPYDMVMAHSILHLVDDVTLELEHISNHLKPGGYFISSTVCLRDMGWFWPIVLPIPSALGLIPKVHPFRGTELIEMIKAAGFDIEWSWQPKSSSVFVIAKKA